MMGQGQRVNYLERSSETKITRVVETALILNQVFVGKGQKVDGWR